MYPGPSETKNVTHTGSSFSKMSIEGLVESPWGRETEREREREREKERKRETAEADVPLPATDDWYDSREGTIDRNTRPQICAIQIRFLDLFFFFLCFNCPPSHVAPF